MLIQKPESLKHMVCQVLLAAGADQRNANGVAGHLVAANLCGVDTHGIIHIPQYIADIRNGQIVPTAWPTIESQGVNHAHVHGHWTFGQIVAKIAMEIAIEKARSHGISVVSLVQSHHIGRLGFYTEMAATAGMIGMVFGGGYCHNAPRAVPYGGREKVLDTNPIAMAFPNGDGPLDHPVMFDFATTATSGVKVANAHRRGESLPEGCIVDRDGHPTTNPKDYMEGGAFIPFGDHKGYAFMFGAELLGRIFAGADQWADADRGSSIFRNQGVTMIVFKVNLMSPMGHYREAVQDLAEKTRATEPAPGFDRVMVPGDPEASTRATRIRDGIPIADDVWTSFVKTAEAVGVEVEIG